MPGLTGGGTRYVTLGIAPTAATVQPGSVILGAAGDTPLIGAGYTEAGPSGVDIGAATSTTGAPLRRNNHTAVWTGTKMIVWGGQSGVIENTGGQWRTLSYYQKR